MNIINKQRIMQINPKYKCSNCGESENIHFNYDYTKAHRPIKEIICNECGKEHPGDMTIDEWVRNSQKARTVVVASVLASMALDLSERALFIQYGEGELTDVGNEIGAALGRTLESLSIEDVTEIITGLRHGLRLNNKS
jgi:hypothetical protein